MRMAPSSNSGISSSAFWSSSSWYDHIPYLFGIRSERCHGNSELGKKLFEVHSHSLALSLGDPGMNLI
jgi:hypothetical protein